MKVSLPHVTLCALDTVHIDLTARIMEYSMRGCAFGDALMVAPRPVAGPFRSVVIGESGPKALEKFYLQEMKRHIRTSHMLSIQYDGYVINPSAWRSEFLDYDYIGAKWAWHPEGQNVGNSGFFLMSKKLLDLWGSPELNPAQDSSDGYLCQTLRPLLEADYGIRFAPTSVADLFSYENSLPRQPTFGFHGLFNLWRHIDDTGMEYVAQKLADYKLDSLCYAKIVAEYYLMRKFAPLRAFYARLAEKLDAEGLQKHFADIFGEAFARELIAVCDNLMQGGGPLPLAPDAPFDIKQPNETIDPRGRLFPWER